MTIDGRVVVTAGDKDERSAYKKLADDLRSAIEQGDYKGGARLPTESELATQYRVSRQTVRRAFQDLVAESLVYRVPGRGTFPMERDRQYLRQFGSIEDLMNYSIDTEMSITSPPRRRVDIDAAGRLRLDSDAVWQTEFLRSHNGVNLCHTTISLPPDIARELDSVEELNDVGTPRKLTVIGLLEGKLLEPITQADQSVTAVAASEASAALLECPVGAPLLRIDRLYLTAAEVPVELAISYFLPDHYSYRLRLSRRAH